MVSAYISGIEVPVSGVVVTANELKVKLKEAVHTEDGISSYWLPRQNLRDGITGDGGVLI